MMPINLKVSGANVALAQMSCGAKGRKTGAHGYYPVESGVKHHQTKPIYLS